MTILHCLKGGMGFSYIPGMSTATPNIPLILVADDDIDDQELIRESFLSNVKHCTVEIVSNGLQAVERLNNDKLPQPRLVILDLNMPMMNGLEVLQRIRDNKTLSDIPVVMFTTSTSPTNRSQSMKLGAKDYIVKPNDFNGLMEVTNKMSEYLNNS